MRSELEGSVRTKLHCN